MDPGDTLGNGRYLLTELVGAGGVGEVWRATDTVLERTVAVKVLKPSLVEEFGAVRRFAAEARVMARLDHRGIAAVYDFGHDADDTAYLVMRFVAGEPLRRIMDRLGAIAAERVLTLLLQAADALDAAHEAGVIHRDVKPGNLLVRADGGVVLTDFGIARATGGAELTGAGMVVGTARYIAPEQASAAQITSAVDVYALGVTAYECLAGQVPFDGESPIDIARQHVESPVPPLPVTVPLAVRELVLQMLAKRPPMRPTAAEVASAARAALAALQAARIYEQEAPVHRRRTLALAATGLVAGLIAVSLIAFGPNGSGADPAAGGLSVGVNSGIGGGASVPPASPEVTDAPSAVAVPTTAGPVVPPHATTRGQSPKPPVRTSSAPPPPTSTPTTAAPTAFPMVSVLMLDLSKATEKLAAVGFAVGAVTTGNIDEAYPECTVVQQDPFVGEHPLGTLVNLVLQDVDGSGCP